MATAVIMPKVGITVERCLISKWLKKVGDKVEIGDVLFTFETDKATFECESTAAGVLLEVFYEEGAEVPVLENVCAIGTPGEDVSALRPAGKSAPSKEPEPPAPAAYTAETKEPPSSGPAFGISPRARNLAERSGVDAALAAPSGPHGRIIERDIRRLMLEGPPEKTEPQPDKTEPAVLEVEYEDVKFTGIRRTISKTMYESLHSMAQLTHHHSFDATAILEYRQTLKASGGELSGVTIGDMILFAVSRVLLNHPDLNANIVQENSLRCFKHVHLGVAVDTPRGLMVPTIFNCDEKSLLEISSEVKKLASLCREGGISPDLLRGGSFTVSNLGSFGVESFTPVINPPQTGILGVCSTVMRPRAGRDGNIELYPAMGLVLTYDHRAIDGAPAARFMSELCKALEQFPAILAR
ncbi:MAG: dihydrolipoamide acetyltransferase family protein [Oscillospiraceae bacterium]